MLRVFVSVRTCIDGVTVFFRFGFSLTKPKISLLYRKILSQIMDVSVVLLLPGFHGRGVQEQGTWFVLKTLFRTYKRRGQYPVRERLLGENLTSIVKI